jgi:hypothetical protein
LDTFVSIRDDRLKVGDVHTDVITPIPKALPWLKVLRSAGRNDFSVRPSNPSPKTISGFALVQVPKSEALVVGVGAAVVAGGAVSSGAGASWVSSGSGPTHSVGGSSAAASVVAAGASAAAVVEVALGVSVEVPAPAPPAVTAALISSGVTSGTRRFWVKIQPLGSLASSPVEAKLDQDFGIRSAHKCCPFQSSLTCLQGRKSQT